jgi:hypothetical protein
MVVIVLSRAGTGLGRNAAVAPNTVSCIEVQLCKAMGWFLQTQWVLVYARYNGVDAVTQDDATDATIN